MRELDVQGGAGSGIRPGELYSDRGTASEGASLPMRRCPHGGAHSQESLQTNQTSILLSGGLLGGHPPFVGRLPHELEKHNYCRTCKGEQSWNEGLLLTFTFNCTVAVHCEPFNCKMESAWSSEMFY